MLYVFAVDPAFKGKLPGSCLPHQRGQQKSLTRPRCPKLNYIDSVLNVNLLFGQNGLHYQQ